jgi:hypothetical protein
MARMFVWGSRIMAFIAFAIGIVGNWNDALQTQGILGLSWQQFAFSLFAIAILFVVIELEIRYQKLEKSHPCITVNPCVPENNKLVLTVTNDGFGGNFSAQAIIKKGTQIHDLIELQWETNSQVRYHIDGGGGKANILVGRLHKNHRVNALSQNPTTQSHSSILQLLTVKQGQPVSLTLNNWELNNTNLPEQNYECEVEVTITSEPTLLKPFKCRLYGIESDGLHLTFSEKLVSRKEDSRP